MTSLVQQRERILGQLERISAEHKQAKRNFENRLFKKTFWPMLRWCIFYMLIVSGILMSIAFIISVSIGSIQVRVLLMVSTMILVVLGACFLPISNVLIGMLPLKLRALHKGDYSVDQEIDQLADDCHQLEAHIQQLRHGYQDVTRLLLQKSEAWVATCVDEDVRSYLQVLLHDQANS